MPAADADSVNAKFGVHKMAIVSFANLDQDFNQEAQLVTITGAGLVVTGLEAYAWTSGTVPVNGVYFTGTGFTYNMGTPTGGTVTAFTLDLDNDGASEAELQITGLSFNPNVLIFGGLTADQQNDLVWRTVLAGDDTVDLGSSATMGGFGIRFAADGSNVESGLSLLGGNDTVDGDAGADFGLVLGDFLDILAGASVIGGDDTITVSADGVYGDAVTVFGFLAAGNDTISALAGGSIDTIYGDAMEVRFGGVVVGGDDTITLSNGTHAVGDVQEVNGALVGGNDTITGGAAGETLRGDAEEVAGGALLLGGNDTIRGGGGDDRIFGDWRSLSLAGTAVGGNDMLYGDAGNDELFGNGGDDLLDGGADTDTLNGGDGNDTYFADVFNDIVVESNASLLIGGNDLVNYSGTGTFTLSANVERLTLTHLTANVNGTGNDLVNTITGNAKNNVLNGGADSLVDILQGGLGNDTYVLGAGNDTVTEANGNSGGIDTATSTIARSLSVGGLVNVENLIMLGAGIGTGNGLNNTLDGSQFAGLNTLRGLAGNDTYTIGVGDIVDETFAGSNGTDTVRAGFSYTLTANVEGLILTNNTVNTNGIGNAGNNALDGGTLAGARVNLLRGLGGNDTYTVGAGDVVDETFAGSGGSDSVRSLVTYTLGTNVENLVLIGTAVINGVGNGLGNTITGNDKANSLNGAAGVDTLNGGLGNDTLTGGIDNDVFVINTAPNGTTNRDLITDLNEAGNDTLWLENTGAGLFNALAVGALAANAYEENLSGLATTATSRIIYEIDTGMLRYDSNGNVAGGTIVHFATLDANQAALYSNADFLVI